MGAKSRSTRSPVALIVASKEVRQHLQRAGQELARAAKVGLRLVDAEARGMGLHRQYPYLQSALKNIQTSVERLMQGSRPKNGKKKG